MRIRVVFVACLFGLLASSVTTEAPAFERQQHVGVDAGLSLFSARDAPSMKVGEGFGLHYAYGLTDAFLLMAEANGQFFSWGSTIADPKTPHSLPSSMMGASVGVGYVLDVIQWVPYVGALAGVEYARGGNLDAGLAMPDVQIAAGLDYMVTRQWAVGVAYRQHMLLTEMSAYPSLSTVFLRAEYVWGW